MKAISNKEKADNARRRLSDWVVETPLQSVPRNQFRRVSRQKVCKLLRISPSSVGSNSAIRKIFDELDDRLEKWLPPRTSTSNEVAFEQTDIHYHAPSEQSEMLLQKLARLSYLEEFATWIPE